MRLTALILLALSCVIWTTASADAFQPKRQVLAYYYPWFTQPKVNHPGETNFGSHWDVCNEAAHTCTGTPWYPATAYAGVAGPYGTDVPVTIIGQFAAMHRLGITGAIVSWWGTGSAPDLAMPAILAAAKTNGMKVAVALDTLLPGTTPTQNLEYLLTNYGSNSAYLTVKNGNPVVFVNSIAYRSDYNGLTTEAAWRLAENNALAHTGRGVNLAIDQNDVTEQPPEVADGFSPICYDYGTHSQFNRMSLTQIQAQAKSVIKSLVDACAPAISVASFFPQHDDYVVHNGRGYYVDAHGGGTMQATLDAAIAANPDWLLLVSWNEWGEGSQCEPSVQLGSPCIGSDITAKLAAFMALPRKQH